MKVTRLEHEARAGESKGGQKRTIIGGDIFESLLTRRIPAAKFNLFIVERDVFIAHIDSNRRNKIWCEFILIESHQE
jgi:hypothetical protein